MSKNGFFISEQQREMLAEGYGRTARVLGKTEVSRAYRLHNRGLIRLSDTGPYGSFAEYRTTPKGAAKLAEIETAKE